MSGSVPVEPPLDPSRSRRTLLVASLATLATFLDTTILYVAFPDIRRTFSDTSASELSWVLNAYTIVFAALLIPVGKLSDRIGHRRIFLIGSVVFTVASMACGLAPNAEILIAFRILQAVGAAGLIPSSLALVIDAFRHDQLPRAVAIWGVAGAVAGAIGPTFGAALIEGLNWRWAFFINLPIGVYTVVSGRRNLRERSDPTTRVPAVPGILLIVAAAGLISYGLVGIDEHGWFGTRTPTIVGIGAVLLLLFVTHERRTTSPALDLDLFRIRNFTWASLAGLVFGVAFSAMFFGSILFLTEVWNWSILAAGLGLAPSPIMVAVLAPRIGGLAGRIGQRSILITGGILYASAGVYRLLWLGPDSNYLVEYLPSMALSGLGVVCIIPQLSSVVAQALPPNRRGVGSAAVQAVRQFGGTFGVALTVGFLAVPGGIADYDRIWWLIVVGGLGTSILALPLRTGGVSPRPAPDTGDRGAGSRPGPHRSPHPVPERHPRATPRRPVAPPRPPNGADT